MLETCRLCLTRITGTNFVNFENRSDVEQLSVKEKLAVCIPEINPTLVVRSVICAACARTLNTVFQFKCSCLGVEKCIRDYINDNEDVGGQIQTLNRFDYKEDGLHVSEEHCTIADDNVKLLKLLSDDAAIEIEMKLDISDEEEVKIEQAVTSEGAIEIDCPEEPDEDYIIALLTLQNPVCSAVSENESQKVTVNSNDLGYIVPVPNGNSVLCVCSTCNYRCIDKDRFEKHIKTHMLVTKQLPCSFCDYVAQKACDMTAHIEEQHKDEKQYQCEICQAQFAIKASLMYHVRNHTSEKPLQCPSCSYRTAHKSNLGKHLLTHGDKQFMCEICSKEFTRKSYLQRHLILHTGEKPFVCELCDKKFPVKSDLKMHTKTHDEEMIKQSYECYFCKFVCKSRTALKFHIQRHMGVKPFKCNFCNYRCLNKVRLVHHTRTHTGEKPFTCGICGSSFPMNASLKIHMRIHTQEKPFVCELCGYRSVSSSGLVVHKRCHTHERRYACQVCNKRFAKNSTLKNHVKIHNQNLECT